MDKQITLKPLSPNKELNNDENGNYKIYKQILDDALGNQKSQIKNIAITGKYGSGKSSLIDSYFTNDDVKDRYLKVTSATFVEGKANEKNSEGKEVKQIVTSNLMANIINQIIYQINPHNIPLTKFKIKAPLSTWKKWLYIVEMLLLFVLFTGQIIKLPTSATGVLINGVDIVPYLREILCIVIIGQILWKLLSVFDPTKFKFAFKNVETEIDLSRDDLFEKHIDEIIYLFK